jgi:hypothetical protein
MIVNFRVQGFHLNNRPSTRSVPRATHISLTGFLVILLNLQHQGYELEPIGRTQRISHCWNEGVAEVRRKRRHSESLNAGLCREGVFTPA